MNEKDIKQYKKYLNNLTGRELMDNLKVKPLTGAEVNEREFMKLFTLEQIEIIKKDIQKKVKRKGMKIMKIFEKDGWIFIQLMDMTTKKMLMDFSVGKEFFNELRDHIIEHLLSFKIDDEKIETEEEAQREADAEEAIEVVQYLTDMAENLDPKTHCCECTPGDHFERHGVHIQYPDCKCDPEKFVLKRN